MWLRLEKSNGYMTNLNQSPNLMCWIFFNLFLDRRRVRKNAVRMLLSQIFFVMKEPEEIRTNSGDWSHNF